MTEQELRGKMADIFEQAYWFARQHPSSKESLDIPKLTLTQADQILALIKEAGYKSPEEVMEMFKGFEETIKLLREQLANSVTQESVILELQSWLDNNLPLESCVRSYIDKLLGNR